MLPAAEVKFPHFGGDEIPPIGGIWHCRSSRPCFRSRKVVIDPASRFRGGEENSNEDATRFVEALESLAKRTGAAVLIAHHTNKVSYASDVAPGQGASRGASALTDGMRWQMNLSTGSTKKQTTLGQLGAPAGTKFVTATVTKTNYAALPEPVTLERLQDGYLSVLSATQATQRRMNVILAKLLDALSTQPRALTARAAERQFGGVNGPMGISIHDLRNLIKIAVTRGLLSGGDRTPLTVTALGSVMAQTHKRTEDATKPDVDRPRKKTKQNQ